MKRIADYIGNQKGGGTAAQKQLRQLVDRYPYYQAARLLLLRALYEAHDPSFGQELRRAAIYVPSRQVLYQLIEADRLKPTPEARVRRAEADDLDEGADRTRSLIDSFLLATPSAEEEQTHRHRTRPTVDAATDYVGYMLQIEADVRAEDAQETPSQESPLSYGQKILDNFLEQQGGRIVIQEHPDEELQTPQIDSEEEQKKEILTETLARIYIKQGKYDKALEIIRRLSLKYPKKNRYFADQIRYLEKLIVNNNNK